VIECVLDLEILEMDLTQSGMMLWGIVESSYWLLRVIVRKCNFDANSSFYLLKCEIFVRILNFEVI
jgi:hypothetical protein